MPEGDTVYRAAHKLDRAMRGQVLRVSDLRVPDLATTDLSGWTVLGTVARGKHLLTRFTPPETAGGVRPMTLHTHLKMEGHWQVGRAPQRVRGPEHHVRVRLRTDEVEAIGTQVLVGLRPTAEEDHWVGRLGPDLLGSDWDPHEALRRLRARPEVAVADALLDQRNLAGIGNVYKCELCFLQGVHPATPVGSVRDLPRMVARAHQLLEANKGRAARVTTGDSRPGRRTWIYGRRGPCLRCGTPVRQMAQGPAGQERETWWCPTCQPEPA